MGVTQSLGSLGRIVGPPYGGLTYARINFYFPFLSAAAATLAALGDLCYAQEMNRKARPEPGRRDTKDAK